MKGQSLAEVLIGVGLGALFIMGSAAIIAPSLKTNTQVTQVQTSAALVKELSDNVRAWAAGNWNNVLSVSTGSANIYYLNTSNSPFVALGTSTAESVIVGSTTYTRYFYVSDMYRDSSGYATSTASGNNYDPSTKQITVVASVASATSTPISYTMYLTRNANSLFSQTSWSGGSGQNSAVTFVSNQYATSTNVSIVSGQITLATSTPAVCSY